MKPVPDSIEFTSTPGGTIAVGLRRLGWLFAILAILMILAAIASWFAGPSSPACWLWQWQRWWEWHGG